ncbi:hypothetical protein [Paraburkholderia sp. CNPSo 3274]|nr:hypothetical protein [Paraburkholderia sp. CNPSo 3274]
MSTAVVPEEAQIVVRPLSAHIGAEISGVDLSRPGVPLIFVQVSG